MNLTQSKKISPVFWITIMGFLVRLVFLKWGAPIYYGRPDYSTALGDTWSWMSAMQNLVHTGTYTIDPSYQDGMFYRPPGYAFILMIFYFITGFDVPSMPPLIIFTQAALDSIGIYLIYKIVLNSGSKQKTANIAALLYCFYPFSIVWTAVLTAESTSVFFMLWSLYHLTKWETKRNYLMAGLLLGCSVLLRVQTMFIFPAYLLFLYLREPNIRVYLKKSTIYFVAAFTLSYGLWPIRNMMHGRFIPAQELVNNKHFSEDYVAFMYYIWSVKTDHRPQYDQLLKGEPVEWPKASYLHPGDSATLAHVSRLCSTCGRGFSYFQYSQGLIKTPIKEYNACSQEITATFKRLREEQIRDNAFHYYISIPLQNFKKAIFKSGLYEHPNKLVVLASNLLFLYRTICILLGLAGVYILLKRQTNGQHLAILILTYFILWYSFICTVYRNMEMRFLLPNDILLLIPLSFFIIFFIDKEYKYKRIN